MPMRLAISRCAGSASTSEKLSGSDVSKVPYRLWAFGQEMSGAQSSSASPDARRKTENWTRQASSVVRAASCMGMSVLRWGLPGHLWLRAYLQETRRVVAVAVPRYRLLLLP